MAQKSTTASLIKKNKCYCLRQQKVVALSKCDMFNCNREKKCRQKSNRDYSKSLKKGNNSGQRRKKAKGQNTTTKK